MAPFNLLTRSLCLAIAALHLAGARRRDLHSQVMLNSDAVSGKELSGENATSPFYLADMLRLKSNGYQSMFCGLSQDDCLTLDGYPGSNVHNELSWQAVVDGLQEVPAKQDAGKITRGNELGYLRLNSGLWSRDFKAIGLAATVEQHRWFRPMADALLGSAAEGKIWSKEMIDKSLDKFLSPLRDTLNTGTDVASWSLQLLHKIHLNIELSPQDLAKFIEFQGAAVVKIVLPTTMGFGDLQDTRDYFLNKYEEAIKADTRGIFPTDSPISPTNLRFIAASLMDSLLFAGGLSVSTILRVALCVLYADPSPWQATDKEMSEERVEQFAFEVLRRYPAVVGFPWHPSEAPDSYVVMNLAMALRDPRVWGSDSLDFKLRPLETYKKLARVAWAEPSNGPAAWAVQDMGRTGNLLPMSRGCPGQALSWTMITSFLKKWAGLQKQFAVASAPAGGLVFTDATPFTGSPVLAKILKEAPLKLVESHMMSYEWKNIKGVLTSGNDQQPALLMLQKTDDKPHRKDNPDGAIAKIVLKDLKEITLKSKAFTSEDHSKHCFKVSGGSSYRLCLTEGGEEEREEWLCYIFMFAGLSGLAE